MMLEVVYPAIAASLAAAITYLAFVIHNKNSDLQSLYDIYLAAARLQCSRVDDNENDKTSVDLWDYVCMRNAIVRFEAKLEERD